jgi:hypothetical protein
MERYENDWPPSARGDEKALAGLMYRKAYENILANPMIFTLRVASGAAEFIATLPSTLMHGYLTVPPSFEAGLIAFRLVAGLGLILLLFGMPRYEIAFWALLWISVAVSAGFVYFDDGRRVMIAIYPLAALFFASGLRTTTEYPAEVRLLLCRARTGAIAAAALLLAIFLVPWLAHIVLGHSGYLLASVARNSEEHFVFGGRRITGVLVVADNEPLQMHVPTMHLSDFANMVRESGIELYQGLVTPQSPPTPFGFVTSPQLIKGKPTVHQFIVPAEVMTRKEVHRWRFETTNFLARPGMGPYWLRVTKAEPMPVAHAQAK